jgi:hypothetical protein
VKKEKTRVILHYGERANNDCYTLRSSRITLRRFEDGGDYENNAVNIHVGRDGSLSFFSDDVESHIYLYPDQINHLRKALSLLPRSASGPKGERT